jgi:hypothetical protein
MSGSELSGAGARRAARSEWTKRLGRLGFLAKGLVYAVVALIAIEVASGEKKKAESEEGAITHLAEESFGEALLVVLAIGLAGYALWRLRVAILGPPGESGAHAAMERVGSIVLVVVYAALCVYTVRFLTSDTAHGGTRPDEVTKKLLDQDYGVALVIALGVVMLGVAAYEAYKGLARAFLDDLETGRMSAPERRLATVGGMAGYTALAVTSLVVGVFLIKAAVEHDPKEAVGLDGALQELVTEDLGPLLLWVVAIGLLIYAGYCVIQSRYRRL